MHKRLSFLADFCRGHLLDEKILIIPSYQIGNQIGETLTIKGHSWVNLHFAILASLAQEIAGAELSSLGVRQISWATSLFIVDRIFRSLKEEGKLDYFGELEASSGIIRAIYRSILALRLAGLKSKDLYPESFISKNKGKEVIFFLKNYEEELNKGKLIDLAGLYSFAIEKAETMKCNDKKFFLCLRDQALTRMELNFLTKIAGENLILVPQDPIFGLKRPRRFSFVEGEIATLPSEARNDKVEKESRPSSDLERTPWLFILQDAPPPFKDKTLDLFSAIGPANECREILRRIIHENLSLDEIEIIHPPGSIYPSLFHVLSAKAGLRVTYADGIALTFTSPGKVFNGLVDWLESNFQVSDLCRMIEGGDLRFPHEKGQSVPSPLKISRYLKNAMIGWDRTRYLSRLETLIKSIENNLDSVEEEGETEKVEKYKANIKEVRWLAKVVKQFLELMPLWDKEGILEFGALCRGVSEFIKKFSRIRNELDREALSLISSRLEEAASVGVSFLKKEEAFEWLRSLGAGLCVGASGPLPGYLHLSSYHSGGYSGRPVSFIVGLDQGAFPGTGLQDPILLDEEREKISKDLSTTSDALRENIYSMAGLLSSLRGKAILSYSSYDIIEERQSFPSSLMLQAHRLIEGDSSLDYSSLLSSLPESSGFLPKTLDKIFDEIDWWLSRLAPAERLRDGLDAVKEHFPELGRGIYALEMRAGSSLSAFEGRVAIDPTEAHPLWNKDIVMSSSRIELLAGCPFAYFLQYILDVWKPEELEFDQSQWLNPMQRGSLLHDIFFRFMKELRQRKEEVNPQKHAPVMSKIAEEIILGYREEIPPPSEGIFERERKEVVETLGVFLTAENKREEKVEPLMFEVSFGIEEKGGEGIKEPVVIKIHPMISFFLRGKIDRIDRLGEHLYRVIDYKTGRYSAYEDLVCFGCGTMLQHVLYSIAAEQIIKKIGIDSSPQVVQSGYYFPTRKGDGREILVDRFDRGKLYDLLLEILSILSKGHFVVNPEADCSFCDFMPICGEDAAKKAKAKKEFNIDEFRIFDKLRHYK
jgi:ATP-dependent helicase/nuclease subunit B